MATIVNVKPDQITRQTKAHCSDTLLAMNKITKGKALVWPGHGNSAQGAVSHINAFLGERRFRTYKQDGKVHITLA